MSGESNYGHDIYTLRPTTPRPNTGAANPYLGSWSWRLKIACLGILISYPDSNDL